MLPPKSPGSTKSTNNAKISPTTDCETLNVVTHSMKECKTSMLPPKSPGSTKSTKSAKISPTSDSETFIVVTHTMECMSIPIGRMSREESSTPGISSEC